MFATALPVALPRHATEPAERPTDCADRQRDIDVGGCVADALGLLLGSSTRQHDHGAGRADQPGELEQLLFADAGDALHHAGPVAGYEGSKPLESFRSRL